MHRRAAPCGVEACYSIKQRGNRAYQHETMSSLASDGETGGDNRSSRSNLTYLATKWCALSRPCGGEDRVR